MNTKMCSRCLEIKELNNYYKHSQTKDNLRPECVTCFKKYMDSTHKNRLINGWIKQGIKYHDYNELYEIYSNATNCAICDCLFDNSKNKSKVLDHQWSSGSPRAVVCRQDNLNVITKLDRKRNSLLLELHRYFIYHQ